MTLAVTPKQPEEQERPTLPAYRLGPPRAPGEPFPFLSHRTMAEILLMEGGVR